MTDDAQLDLRVRTAAFRWLKDQNAVHGDVLPYKVLLDGFRFEGQQVKLIGPKGHAD